MNRFSIPARIYGIVILNALCMAAPVRAQEAQAASVEDAVYDGTPAPRGSNTRASSVGP